MIKYCSAYPKGEFRTAEGLLFVPAAVDASVIFNVKNNYL